MKLYRELLARYAPDDRPGLFHTYSFGIAQTLVEGLRRAGRDPDPREAGGGTGDIGPLG